MEFNFRLVVYDGMWSDDLCQFAGQFLLGGPRRSFGLAVTRFDLYAWAKTRRRGSTPLDWMEKRWNKASEDLPRIAFLRKRARFDISFVTSLPKDFDRKLTAAQSLKRFCAAAHEIASALQLAKQRRTKTDDFDWDGFCAQVNRQLAKLPTTTRELTELLKRLKNKEAARRTNRPLRAELSARVLRKKPQLIAIDHDEHHASHIGHFSNGRQFFLTTPFVSASGADAGREFVALYLFDKHGRFLEARVDDLGRRANLNEQRARRIFEQRLAELGPVEYGRIEVQPFEVRRFGTKFGLVPRAPEDEDDEWVVEMQPGNYMAFFEPWDNGDYDT